MSRVIRTVTIAWQKVLRVSLLTAYYFLHPYSLISDVVFNTLRAPHLSVQSPCVTSSVVPARGHLPYAPEDGRQRDEFTRELSEIRTTFQKDTQEAIASLRKWIPFIIMSSAAAAVPVCILMWQTLT